MLIYVFLALAIIINPQIAHSRDPDGRYAQSPLKGWFESLKDKNGVGCCSTADGLRLEDVDWETKDGRFRVRIDGEWIDVPPEALIEQPNLAGPAIVWPVKSATGKIHVRCFIPGAGS